MGHTMSQQAHNLEHSATTGTQFGKAYDCMHTVHIQNTKKHRKILSCAITVRKNFS